MGKGGTPGVAYSGPHGVADLRGLAADLRASDLLSGNVCGSRTIPRNLLPCGQLGGLGKTTGRGKQCNSYVPNRSIKEVLGYPLAKQFRELLRGEDEAARRRIDVNLDELDRVLDGARQAPLSEDDYEKLKDALHALAAMLVRPRNTEKTSAVLGKNASCGNWCRDSAGEQRFSIARTRTQWCRGVWQFAEDCDCAPEVEARGSLPGVRERQRIRAERAESAGADCRASAAGGHRLLARTVALWGMRAGFTAQEPEGVGPEKYDETAAAMIAQLKYGSGTPFYRLEQLEGQLGIPLPAATQWESCGRGGRVAQTGARRVNPAGGAGRGDTQRRHQHASVTSEHVPIGTNARACSPAASCPPGQGWKIALYFTGRQHAGENLADVLQQRAQRDEPAHSDVRRASRAMFRSCRRGWRFCWRTASPMEEDSSWKWRQTSPCECRYVLEMLGQVYGHDAEARERESDGRTSGCEFHQERSGPVMEQLHHWLEAQFAERKTEPNSGLGKAIMYLLRHWRPLTLFLRQAGAPVDNNIVERALKRAFFTGRMPCSIGR